MSKSVSWFLFVLLSLTWGSSFILMKRGLEVFTPVQVACLRLCFASVVLLPFSFYYFKSVSIKNNWKYFLTVGLFGNFFPAFLFTKAETGISSSTAGILNALTPIFALMLAVVAFKQSFRCWQVWGLLISLAGAIFLMLSGEIQQNSTHPNYGWLAVLATFFYAISVNTIKHFLAGVHSIAITTFALVLVFIPSVFILLQTDFLKIVSQNPHAFSALGYIALLGVWGTAVAVILYNMLIKATGILFSSSVTYFIPVVALFWGILDGEGFYSSQIICVLIIVSGVYLVNYNPKKKIDG